MLTFTAERPRDGEYGIVGHGARAWLARGTERRLAVGELALPGRHNALNALAAMAIADDLGIGSEAIEHTLRTFHGTFAPLRADRLRRWRPLVRRLQGNERRRDGSRGQRLRRSTWS